MEGWVWYQRKLQEVNRHTARHTGHAALPDVWLRAIESEIRAVLWAECLGKDLRLLTIWQHCVFIPALVSPSRWQQNAGQTQRRNYSHLTETIPFSSCLLTAALQPISQHVVSDTDHRLNFQHTTTIIMVSCFNTEYMCFILTCL